MVDVYISYLRRKLNAPGRPDPIQTVRGGGYRLLAYYFETTTDLALQHKIAEVFRSLEAPLPSELAAADRAWHTSRGRAFPERSEEDHPTTDDHPPTDVYDAELAAVFVMPLDARGQLLPPPAAGVGGPWTALPCLPMPRLTPPLANGAAAAWGCPSLRRWLRRSMDTSAWRAASERAHASLSYCPQPLPSRHRHTPPNSGCSHRRNSAIPSAASRLDW